MGESLAKRSKAISKNGNWSWSFFTAFVEQGIFLLMITFLLFIYGSFYLSPTPFTLITSGSAGVWMLFGYAFYLIFVLYLGVSSVIYYMLENSGGMASKNQGWFAFYHYFLANLGIIGTCILLIGAGYRGGLAQYLGLSALQIHAQVLGVYPPFIIGFILIMMLGIVLGWISYYLELRKRR